MEPQSWIETLPNGNRVLHLGDISNDNRYGVRVDTTQWLYVDDIDVTTISPNDGTHNPLETCSVIRDFADAFDTSTKEQQEISGLSWEQMMNGIDKN